MDGLRQFASPDDGLVGVLGTEIPDAGLGEQGADVEQAGELGAARSGGLGQGGGMDGFVGEADQATALGSRPQLRQRP